MSVSITPTRWPSLASWAATLAEMFDLPVPPRNEWTETILDMMLSFGIRLQVQSCKLQVKSYTFKVKSYQLIFTQYEIQLVLKVFAAWRACE